MTPDFWQEKWQSKQIGFNQHKPNPLMVKYMPTLNLAKGSCVFVPLCGKSIDMIWLASQGYEVKAVELVETAVAEFFEENAIVPSITQHPKHSDIKIYAGSYGGQAITIWVADIFKLTAQDIGQVDAIYDRAALVALPDNYANEPKQSNKASETETDSLRVRYSNHLLPLTHCAPQLLLSFGLEGVDESKYKTYPGPPFLISSADIHSYYDSRYELEVLERYRTQRANDNNNPWLNIAWHLIPKAL